MVVVTFNLDVIMLIVIACTIVIWISIWNMEWWYKVKYSCSEQALWTVGSLDIHLSFVLCGIYYQYL